jgi:RNA polymerase sigma-70 factor (ECF subfamily)
VTLDPRVEAELLERARRGDPGAFERIYRIHVDRVMALARHLLRDRAAAEDAVQETFLQAFRGLAGFRGEARLSTWLHRIATNACLRALSRKRHEPLDPDATALAAGSAPACEVQLTLEAILGRLEPEKQVTFLLHHMQGLTTAEIAEVLEESSEAVQKRLQRTRVELMALWMESGPRRAPADPEGGRP